MKASRSGDNIVVAGNTFAPVIPAPFYQGFRGLRCYCGRPFWTVDRYREHYAYEHIVMGAKGPLELQEAGGGMTEREAADIMWDALAQLGLRDHRGGAEYRREFKSKQRVDEFSRAALTIVVRLALSNVGLSEVASGAKSP